MRIALDATHAAGSELTGVGVYSREIARHLAEAHPEHEFRFAYRPHRFLRSLRESLPHNASRRILTDTLVPAADIFHGLNQRLPVRKRSLTVVTFHDLFVISGDYSTPEFRARFTAQARAAAAAADAVIAVSRFTAVQVTEFLGVAAERISVVPHGTSTHAAAPPLERERLILSVGSIQKRKNTSRLVTAFEQLPPGWTLVLAGATGFGAAEILDRIERSPRRADIRVMGWVPAGELDRLYRTAAMLAFPSLDEGFGMPVLDAMSYGLPVLTSNCSALPEVAGDAALLVDPLDEQAIAAGLLRLCGDEALRGELRRRGLERAQAFTWKLAADRTWEVYSGLIR